MLKRLPIGVSDFKKIMTENCYFTDKSLLIKEFIEDGSDVVLIPRPRRFGKTLNLSMLRYFFDVNEEQNLFTDLTIWKHEEYRAFRGKYPVVFLTFKDTKNDNYDLCLFKIKKIIQDILIEFSYLLESNSVSKMHKELLNHLYQDNAHIGEYESSLKTITHSLYEHHGVKPILLIDEYDVPIQAGYTYGYYDEIISFMRNFLSGGLKDNVYLHKAVLTGILRVAKESIFSGLNNLQFATILDIPYSKYFGFSEDEVKEMLTYYSKDNLFSIISKWYNGYIFGKTTIYNPWSLLNFLHSQKTDPEPYWINTSSNDIIRHLLTRGSSLVKQELEALIQGGTILKEINSSIVMSDIEKTSDSVWNFLLFSGYLKAVKSITNETSIFYELKIPNLEVKSLFKHIISFWFHETLRDNRFDLMLKSLLTGDIETFDSIFAEYCLSAFSYFDTEREGEKTYHAFVLGMLISLPKEQYLIKSNRESGLGRYDVIIMPKDISKNGIIIEFKTINKRKKESLEDCIVNAFKQIEEKRYRQELLDFGLKNIYEVAIAIDGKESLAEARKV
jgi:hypothetical protein